MTPGHYLTNVRLENEAKLLTNSTNYGPEYIANKVGFSCGNYFGEI